MDYFIKFFDYLFLGNFASGHVSRNLWNLYYYFRGEIQQRSVNLCNARISVKLRQNRQHLQRQFEEFTEISANVVKIPRQLSRRCKTVRIIVNTLEMHLKICSEFENV